ncbi:MAG: hypothetical protein KDD55_07465 [Bdellovibrionales bacterium]|nr:hypothetical protein [Bdellovibrionales bacterium]
MSFLSRLLLLLVLFNCSCHAQSLKAPNHSTSSPTLWIHPNHRSAHEYSELFSNPTTWNRAKSTTDVFGFFIDHLKALELSTLQSAVSLFEKEKIDIAIEGGGTLSFAGCDNKNGEKSARIELQKIAKIYRAGGKVTWLGMDGPLSRTITHGRKDNCGFSLQTAVHEVVDYMKAIHSVHPEIKIGWIINAPNWSYERTPSYHPAANFGDLKRAIDALVLEIKRSGEKLEFIHIDHPYEYAIGTFPAPRRAEGVDWISRIRSIEKQIKRHQIRFGLIFNAAGGKRARNAPPFDEEFSKRTLAYINLYRKRGGTPDTVILESWYKWPSHLIPENTPYTFMHLVREASKSLERK